MGIKIDVSVEPDYVYLHLSGTYLFADAMKLFEIAVDSAIEADKSKILINAFGVTGHIPTVDRYKIAVFLAEYIKEKALGKISKLALAGNEPVVDPGRFGETTSNNRGVNTKGTTSIEAAIDWLNQ